MAQTFDAHKNFGYSLIAVAPVPAASGTTASVTAGEGALFPAVPFNAVVWPAGTQPTAANAEVVRVTSLGTGDNWTFTRVTESSSARSIALGDQIALAITAKTLTDVEASVAGGTNDFRLTVSNGVAVSPTDVTAAVTLYCTPYKGSQIAIYSAAGIPAMYSSAQFSIAVPAVANQMYDVFVYISAGVPTLELLAWTNDTTRATAVTLVTTGTYTKTGDLTRRYLGSFRTTAVAGQTEDSAAKRYVWNYYNRVRRQLLRQETTGSWSYSTATIRQANASTANQVDVVVGIAEVTIDVSLHVQATNSTGGVTGVAGIGEDSTTVINAGQTGFGYMNLLGASVIYAIPTVRLVKVPAVGRHFYSWLEYSGATATTTWYGATDPLGVTVAKAGLSGSIEG